MISLGASGLPTKIVAGGYDIPEDTVTGDGSVYGTIYRKRVHRLQVERDFTTC